MVGFLGPPDGLFVSRGSSSSVARQVHRNFCVSTRGDRGKTLKHGGFKDSFDMSYGQYSWLITIKNGASHPMVHRDL